MLTSTDPRLQSYLTMIHLPDWYPTHFPSLCILPRSDIHPHRCRMRICELTSHPLSHLHSPSRPHLSLRHPPVSPHTGKATTGEQSVGNLSTQELKRARPQQISSANTSHSAINLEAKIKYNQAIQSTGHCLSHEFISNMDIHRFFFFVRACRIHSWWRDCHHGRRRGASVSGEKRRADGDY